jgi:hypothetical protein
VTIAPTDEDFDDMHHALGRPATLDGEPYRNHFVTETLGPTARRFEALGFWTFTRLMNRTRDSVYRVNDAGKAALADWLKANAKAE